jgi:hypothetical protein
LQSLKDFLAKWFPIRGMITGMLLLTAVVFGFGWVTLSHTATNNTKAAVDQIACVMTAQADPLNVERVAELKAASSYKYSSMVREFGWTDNAGVAKSCADKLLAG